MNKRNQRLAGRLLRMAACLLAIMTMGFNAAALPFDANIYTHYNYSSNGTIVSSPAAYTPSKRIYTETLSGDEAFKVADICVSGDELYVLDGDNGRVYVLDRSYNVLRCLDGVKGSAVTNKLAYPQGLCIADGELYITDTDNRRIVVVDPADGTVLREFADPGIRVLSEEVDFFPIRMSVNSSGRMFVVAKNVNRGLVLLNADGSWNGFMGAPKVKVDWTTYIYRMFATEEQIRRMQAFVPTEYNSVDIDEEGFVYATIGSVSSENIKNVITTKDATGGTTPIKRLNASGDDILSRSGFFAPVGDIVFDVTDGCSTIVDVSVRGGGVYTLLDSRRGHIFTYDQSGNLLYILGGTGDQVGCFSAPSALTWWGETLVVADKSGSLTAFEVTDYGRCINRAVEADFVGDYEASDEYWNLALDYDANLYAAYIGKGKAEYRRGDYLKAMTYYKAVGETDYYSKAKAKYRQEWLADNALIVGIVGVFLLGVLIYFWFFRKKKT